MWWVDVLDSIPFVIPMVMACGISIALLVFSWSRRHVPGVTPFIVICAAAFLWAFGSALEMAVRGEALKLVWANVQYTSFTLLPVAYFALAMQQSGREGWFTWRRLPWLLIIPAVTLVLVWTDSAHHLMRHEVRYILNGPIPVLDVSYGPWFWVHTLYSYTLFAAAIVLLLRNCWHALPLYRGQSLVLLIGLLVPLVVNLLYIFRVSPFVWYDLSPAISSLSGVFIAWGLFQYRLFDIVPVAREHIIERMTDNMILLDPDGRVVDINPAARLLLERESTQVIGQPIAEVLRPWPILLALLENPSLAQAEVMLGGGKMYELRAMPLVDRREQVLGRLLILHDITAQKRVEQELRTSEVRYRTIFANSGTPMIILTEEGYIAQVNSDFTALFGLHEGDVVGRRWTELVEAGDREALAALHGPPHRHECRWLGKGNTAHDMLLTITPIPDSLQSIATLVDITERKRAEAYIRHMAYHDPLTGLPNRKFFLEHVQQELARAQRRGELLAVMLLDLDGFKDINDTHGHQAGDCVLQEVAMRLGDVIRGSDVIARLGGDEFTVLAADLTEVADAGPLAQRINEALAPPIPWGDFEFAVTASIGISIFPQDGETPDELIKTADIAMYRAKKRPGRGTVYHAEIPTTR